MCVYTGDHKDIYLILKFKHPKIDLIEERVPGY